MSTPKYPEIEVQLTESDGNAFAILGKVGRALKAGGVGKAERQEYFNEATSGDYDTVLTTTFRWVEVL